MSIDNLNTRKLTPPIVSLPMAMPILPLSTKLPGTGDSFGRLLQDNLDGLPTFHGVCDTG